VKLLIDQNLSYRLVKPLQEQFPGTEQVLRLGLTDHCDTTIWEYARLHDFVIPTQDEDFFDLSSLRGAPPKVILLRTGNLPSAEVVALLRGQLLMIYTLLAPGSEVNCLELT
jgi:predicted nuclease of predicted toxin-antitoxin system